MALSSIHKMAIGCAITAGVLIFGLLATCLGVGYAIELGIIPDTAALPVGKIPPRQIEQLREMGAS